ncbi:hypothetical protein LUZ63_016402 [Rhynchospora breviuscula]|uniref:non-specific serine/threonine protein kinase n=1 Tax=Rhynchospora breviuscula TaxID=2022672 RepID=A0A9P9Z9U7_9POAL|nr:hypothetical protein LUZ63_016402 [Rhynchospora breviuscula]
MRNLLLLTFLLFCSIPLSFSLTQEGLYLLEAKRGLVDTVNSLADWNEHDSTPCNWTHVSCVGPSVVSLDFANLNLLGPFPPSLCQLPNLTFLSFTYNYINSTLNSSSLKLCQSLSHLDLSYNYLVGPLPDSLAELPSLVHLDLSGNNFSGSIPPSFGKFPKIQRLSLVSNLLTGTVPAFLGDLSTIRHLNLSYNPFSPAPVPASLSKLSSLEVLWLANCNLNGPIPPSLGLLTNLTDLDLSTNHLTGTIPATLSGLSNVIQIELYNNSLTGSIPSGLSKLTSLRQIDLSMNQLEGPLPVDIFDIPLLENLHIYSNRLTGPIPPRISQSTTLTEIRLFSNQLNGTLPANLGKNAPLMWLDLSDNLLTGEIPPTICDHGVLEELLLIDNMFTGSLPQGLAKCRSLTRVRLKNNQLTGEVPDGLWGLPHLYLLELTNNSLSGGISPVISTAANLSKLVISDNKFTGSIPSEIGMLSKLYEISADNNKLSGPLPATLGNLAELGQLNLDNNALSGELLRGIQSWVKLSELNLANNDFTGGIPPELGALPVLNYLDLSGNLLTGQIPNELQNLKLNQLNLSNNKLTGPLPRLFATEAYRDSFLGNPGLCGDLPDLCMDSNAGSGDRPGYVWMLRSIFIFAAIVFIIGVSWFYWRYIKFSKAKRGFDKSKWTLTSFHKLGFSEYEILDCLDEDNVIGSGASGKVYKAVLSHGEIVAVKKLYSAVKKEGDGLNQASLIDDAFEAEVATLGKIRHKNIVKLWCCCIHKESKLLVYEYMPNGSLGDLLHSNKGGILDWQTRYKIALDSAEGLSYLHHDCVPPIVHRDVKSNNILLDAEFGARVADFGVAKVVEAIGNGSNSMSVIAGSCGYIAPEYAYTLRVNEKSDTYSFGVVLLELVTGKPPVDPDFGEKDLVKWVSATMEQKGIDPVIDTKLDLAFKEEILKVLQIGLLCASSLPINRPSMRRVVKMLQEARAECKARSEKKDGHLSPYFLEEASDNGSVA